ncbi:MAG TPA: biopolymer transporter ExbD [Bacteroidales bacterium]|jgi:biopolymer transport protein ExbD|nr:biopolymer transporter ExbD [Bacteroidales bacterium]HBZ35537.1 biopolymer transporter ExbD [Rikenellaceae bacterium]HON54134.1 biopolymer transporter ExbD [Bacteroidales bacterium]HRR48746.1 biopolymer transporter ExbD [Bacteroidales bacterium]HRT33654.1 biopolymer transporter ExbD [Bacteroidales bacterium]
MARPVNQVNASSTADMAFIILVFFLITSNMDSNSGLQRRLPPMPDKNQKVVDQKVNRRNVLVVRINESDRLFAGGQIIDISMLKDKAKEFLLNPNNDPSLPEKEDKFIEGFGMYPVSKGIISLQNTRGTSYDAYIRVQNELVKAVNEVRNQFALEHFGKSFFALDEAKQEIVRKAIPQNISEAEPKDTGKKY